MAGSIEKANDKFQNYLMWMPDNLAELGSYVKEYHGRVFLLPGRGSMLR